MLINTNFKVLYKKRYSISTKNPKRIAGILFLNFLLQSLFSGRLCVFSNHFLYVNPNISFPLIFPFSCKMHPLLTSLAHSVTGIVTHTTHVTNFICCSFCLA